MSFDATTWTVPIGMGLLLLTPSVVLIGFLFFHRPRLPRTRREVPGFPVITHEDEPPRNDLG